MKDKWSGWHEKAGQPHAEINALNDAGKQHKAQQAMSHWNLVSLWTHTTCVSV